MPRKHLKEQRQCFKEPTIRITTEEKEWIKLRCQSTGPC